MNKCSSSFLDHCGTCREVTSTWTGQKEIPGAFRFNRWKHQINVIKCVINASYPSARRERCRREIKTMITCMPFNIIYIFKWLIKFKMLPSSTSACILWVRVETPTDHPVLLLILLFSVGQLCFLIRQRLSLRPEEALFFFINNSLPPSSSPLSAVYEVNTHTHTHIPSSSLSSHS